MSSEIPVSWNRGRDQAKQLVTIGSVGQILTWGLDLKHM